MGPEWVPLDLCSAAAGHVSSDVTGARGAWSQGLWGGAHDTDATALRKQRANG